MLFALFLPAISLISLLPYHALASPFPQTSDLSGLLNSGGPSLGGNGTNVFSGLLDEGEDGRVLEESEPESSGRGEYSDESCIQYDPVTGLADDGYDSQGARENSFSPIFSSVAHLCSLWSTGLDADGFAPDGFNSQGFNRAGVNRAGFKSNGLDDSGKSGYVNGRDANGRDIHDRDSSGLDSAGNRCIVSSSSSRPVSSDDNDNDNDSLSSLGLDNDDSSDIFGDEGEFGDELSL
ncbi:hypothetical protein JCM8547_005300 [Rhodosporidiobolus lusitaniae]